MSRIRPKNLQQAGTSGPPQRPIARMNTRSTKAVSKRGSNFTPHPQARSPSVHSKADRRGSLSDFSSDLSSPPPSDSETMKAPQRRPPSHQDVKRLGREANSWVSLGHKVASEPFDFFQLSQSWGIETEVPENVKSRFEMIGQTTAFLIGLTAADAGINLATGWEMANLSPSNSGDIGSEPSATIPRQTNRLPKDQLVNEATTYMLDVETTSAPWYEGKANKQRVNWRNALRLCNEWGCVLGGWPYPDIYPSSQYKGRDSTVRASFLKDLGSTGGRALVQKYRKDRDQADENPDCLQLKYYPIKELNVTDSGQIVPSNGKGKHASNVRPLKFYPPQSRPLVADPNGHVIVSVEDLGEHQQIMGRARKVLTSGQGDKQLPSLIQVTTRPEVHLKARKTIKAQKSAPNKRRKLALGGKQIERGSSDDDEDEYEDEDEDEDEDD